MDDDGTAGCLYLVIYAVVSTWSVVYMVESIWHQTIHWFGALIIGFLFGGITIPVSLFLFLLHLVGIQT